MGGPADHELGKDQRQAYQQDQEQVKKQESGAAVYAGQVGKTPDIAQSDG